MIVKFVRFVVVFAFMVRLFLVYLRGFSALHEGDRKVQNKGDVDDIFVPSRNLSYFIWFICFFLWGTSDLRA